MLPLLSFTQWPASLVPSQRMPRGVRPRGFLRSGCGRSSPLGAAGDELILGAIDRTDLAEWMKLIGEAIAQLREKDEVLKSSLGRLTSNEGVTGDIQIRVGAED